MRLLSGTLATAAVAMVAVAPTAIAGIYGVNFARMPELEWRYGYFAVLAIIVAVCAYLFVRFRRAGWIQCADAAIGITGDGSARCPLARPHFQTLAEAANGSFNDHTGSMIESVLLSVLVN